MSLTDLIQGIGREIEGLVCSHCGYQGKDVIREPAYLGGQGYVPTVHCQDRLACWRRWDEQNGIKTIDPNLEELCELIP